MIDKKVAMFSHKQGLFFSNPMLLETALTHRSAGGNNNERLEFLGDSILGFVVAERIYNKFPEASEGVLSRLRSSLVNKDSLADMARSMDIGNYLIMGAGEIKNGGFKRDSILSDSIESVIGALFIDQGFIISKRWVLKIFADKINQLTMNGCQKDPKTQLQELMQSKGLDVPIYTLNAQTGLAHAQKFKIECHISLFTDAILGAGVSRKKAEQNAAQLMLLKLISAEN